MNEPVKKALLILYEEVKELKEELANLKADVKLLEEWCYGGSD